MSHYPEPDSYGRNKTKVELDLSNYPRKSNTKNVTGVDISDFTKKANLTGLKWDIDELNIQGTSQEGKKLYVLHELRNKT